MLLYFGIWFFDSSIDFLMLSFASSSDLLIVSLKSLVLLLVLVLLEKPVLVVEVVVEVVVFELSEVSNFFDINLCWLKYYLNHGISGDLLPNKTIINENAINSGNTDDIYTYKTFFNI